MPKIQAIPKFTHVTQEHCEEKQIQRHTSLAFQQQNKLGQKRFIYTYLNGKQTVTDIFFF